MLSLHVKRSPSVWLPNKLCLPCFTGVYIINRILHTRLWISIFFIFSFSARYLTRSLRSFVRYRVEDSKIKFISTRGHVISSIYLSGDNFLSISSKWIVIFYVLDTVFSADMFNSLLYPFLLQKNVQYFLVFDHAVFWFRWQKLSLH